MSAPASPASPRSTNPEDRARILKRSSFLRTLLFLGFIGFGVIRTILSLAKNEREFTRLHNLHDVAADNMPKIRDKHLYQKRRSGRTLSKSRNSLGKDKSASANANTAETKNLDNTLTKGLKTPDDSSIAKESPTSMSKAAAETGKMTSTTDRTKQFEEFDVDQMKPPDQLKLKVNEEPKRIDGSATAMGKTGTTAVVSPPAKETIQDESNTAATPKLALKEDEEKQIPAPKQAPPPPKENNLTSAASNVTRVDTSLSPSTNKTEATPPAHTSNATERIISTPAFLVPNTVVTAKRTIEAERQVPATNVTPIIDINKGEPNQASVSEDNDAEEPSAQEGNNTEMGLESNTEANPEANITAPAKNKKGRKTRKLKPADIPRVYMPDLHSHGNVSLPAPKYPEIVEFERQEGVVIATKLHGPHQLPLLQQSLCLLTKAYNNRMNYDIVAFTTMPIDDALVDPIREVVAPAKITVLQDNAGTLQKQVASLSEEKRRAFLERCGQPNADNMTWWAICDEERVGKGRIAYNWQAEFRTLHIWTHPVLAQYKYMMWLDTDGFSTQVWDRDPIAVAMQHDMVIFFANFPQGHARGEDAQERIKRSFNTTLCKVKVKEGHLKAKTGKNCPDLNIQVVHGFFHITNLDFYRTPIVQNFYKNIIGDCFCCRRFDDQLGVTAPAAMLAPERSWDMYWYNVRPEVFHNFNMDGKKKLAVGGFMKYWKRNGKTRFPEAWGTCKVTQGG